MSLKNCVECGALMVENPSGLCPKCREEEEAAEDKVVEYLRTARKASVNEIEEATGVKIKVIMRMLKRGRIMGSDCVISYPCERCGELITDGRMCEVCTRNITSQIKVDEWQPPKQEVSTKKDGRMYINDMLKK